MAVYEIVFSPTGGTQKVSGLFTRSFCQESTQINLVRRDVDVSVFSFRPEDICIVSVPSYGGRVPSAAVSRLGRIKGNGAKAVLIVVYGNRDYDDTFAELKEILENSGFSCAAAVAAVAEHSIMRQFASGRPDIRDEEELFRFAEVIRDHIESGTLSASLKIPGGRPYREFSGVPMKPRTGRSCNQCGICAKECPVDAILSENSFQTDTAKCISCMRCITVCPKNARSVSKALLTAGSMKMKKECSKRKGNELFI